MDVIWVYVTCASQDEARKIAGALVERKLIACANIMAPHTAVYRWDGQVQTGPETAMVLKTGTDRFEAVKKEICALHSYDCPCILALPVSAGHEPFLQWIAAEIS